MISRTGKKVDSHVLAETAFVGLRSSTAQQEAAAIGFKPGDSHVITGSSKQGVVDINGKSYSLLTDKGLEEFLNLFDANKRTQLKSFFKSNTFSRLAIDEIAKFAYLLQQAEQGKTRITTLVISGHHSFNQESADEDSVWSDDPADMTGLPSEKAAGVTKREITDIKFPAFRTLFKMFSNAASQIQFIALSMCTSDPRNDEDTPQLREMLKDLPNLKKCWAYTEKSPTTYAGTRNSSQYHLQYFMELVQQLLANPSKEIKVDSSLSDGVIQPVFIDITLWKKKEIQTSERRALQGLLKPKK